MEQPQRRLFRNKGALFRWQLADGHWQNYFPERIVSLKHIRQNP